MSGQPFFFCAKSAANLVANHNDIFMVHLTVLDYFIIFGLLILCFGPALLFGRKSGKSTTAFFAANRSVPWWLAGLSMVATTFSSDTPNLVTNIVRTQGVAGNWQWWAFTLTGVATVFFYARLWRRSGVMTDLEFYELRYSGSAARVVRGFRAVYLGFFFNCMILATVNLAACKIANILFGLPRWETLLGIGLLNVAFAAHSGLMGVLVIDMIQFFVKMTAVIAAAYFALKQPQVGGLSGMVTKISTMRGPEGIHYLNMMPDFSNAKDIAVAVFVIPIVVQWWSSWYPGAEPGGGSYIAQRMLASKTEKDSLGGVLFFNLAHYVLRPWPWILVGLCSLLVYPTLADIKTAFPNLDPKMLGHDIAYPAMLHFMPAGWFGLMIGGLIAANSSTVLTHLNWGASYLVHDFYRRFVKADATEAHYVAVGRLATVVLFVCAGLLTFILDTASDAFHLILLVGAGTGLLYLVRWFWWRVNAWSEVAAMISSFVVSIGFKTLDHAQIGPEWIHDGTNQFLLTILLTTICWVGTAFLAPGTDRETLVRFYLKVRPAGPGWNEIRALAADAAHTDESSPDNIPLAIVGWISGCITIWSGLFAVGNVLYGRWGYAVTMMIILAAAGGVLIAVVRRLWAAIPSPVEAQSLVGT